MRFEDDDGVIVSLSSNASVRWVKLQRARDRGKGYEIRVTMASRDESWHDFEIYYQDRDRALHVLAQFEELFAT